MANKIPNEKWDNDVKLQWKTLEDNLRTELYGRLEYARDQIRELADISCDNEKRRQAMHNMIGRIMSDAIHDFGETIHAACIDVGELLNEKTPQYDETAEYASYFIPGHGSIWPKEE